MDKLPFLRTQRNWIFEQINNLDLDPREFEWGQRAAFQSDSKRLYPALIHRPTEYYYLFKTEPDGTHWPEYSPGRDKVVHAANGAFPGQVWKNVEQALPLWLSYLKREIEAPDLWTALQQESQLIDAAVFQELDDRPFTPNELVYIRQSLDELKKFIAATQQLSAERSEFVNQRLDYLQDAAKRQGRQSWLHTTIGVLFTIVIGAALSPDAARELFRFAATVLSQVIKAPLILP